MRNNDTLLDIFYFYVIEASRHIEKGGHTLESPLNCPIQTALNCGWNPIDILWGEWKIKYNFELREWQATHENYDGAPDGNRHLYIHDSSLVYLLNELDSKYK